MGLAPSEFRRLKPRQFWWLMDDLMAEQRALRGESAPLLAEEKDELMDLMRAHGADI